MGIKDGKSDFGINYLRLPEHMRDGARMYVEHGIEGGSFMTAVFSNDLLGAFGAADEINTYAMRDWAAFLYNDVPATCKGSREIVYAWIDKGGLHGLPKGGNDHVDC